MIRNYLLRLATPGEVSPHVALTASVLAMAAVFAFDLLSPADIRLHVLYIFPLAAITLHCGRPGVSLGVLVLSVAFQLLTFFLQGVSVGPFVTDAVVAFTSSVLTIVLARILRENYLAAANLATLDPLTGMLNRRGFESLAEAEIAKQRRYGGVFSLVILDLDNFKDLNDSQGHHAGDEALQLFGDVLREHLRQSDVSARLGGDEFAILMPNTREVDCSALCRKLSALIVKRMAEAGFAISASIGSATFDRAPESMSCAFQKSDAAMYEAKADTRKLRGRAATPSGGPVAA